jgi:hypothetical protein
MIQIAAAEEWGMAVPQSRERKKGIRRPRFLRIFVLLILKFQQMPAHCIALSHIRIFPVKKAPKKKRKIIEANCIHLLDEAGNVKISLDAGGEDGYAAICLFAKDGKSIQISTQPDGSLSIALFGKRCTNHAILSMAENESTGLDLRGRDGKLGAILAEEPDTLTHRLLLFKNGEHFWSTPTGREEKKPDLRLKGKKKKPAVQKPK